jgi:hypothetical protein
LASYERAIATAKDGTSPRRPLDARVAESLAIAARYKFNDLDRELSAWQQRCLGAEDQLRRSQTHVRELEAHLRDLDQVPPPPPADPGRPRWSLRRRIRKILGGLQPRGR